MTLLNESRPMNFTGSPKIAFTVNGSVPAPTLRWKEGDTVTLRVANTLNEDASIHWHGILLPANMDGVPGLSFHGVRPGETYVYRFKVRQGGTYWYHSHSGFLEQRGIYGPLVIEPLEPEPFKYDREHVVMLTDWTDESPEWVFAKLKKQSDYYNRNQRTVGDFLRDLRTGFAAGTLAVREGRALRSRNLILGRCSPWLTWVTAGWDTRWEPWATRRRRPQPRSLLIRTRATPFRSRLHLPTRMRGMTGRP